MEQTEDSLNEQNDNKTADRLSPSPNNSYEYRKPSIESNSSYTKNDERRVSKQDKEVNKNL